MAKLSDRILGFKGNQKQSTVLLVSVKLSLRAKPSELLKDLLTLFICVIQKKKSSSILKYNKTSKF